MTVSLLCIYIVNAKRGIDTVDVIQGDFDTVDVIQRAVDAKYVYCTLFTNLE